HPCTGKDPADRLDSERLAVLIDVVDQHRGTHLILRSSSAAAKNADAVRKISFARRNPRTSRSSSVIRVRSAVVGPGRSPASTWSGGTQAGGVSGLFRSGAATGRSAPVLVAGSRLRSTALRIARSRSSSGYFLGAAMTLILPRNESLHQTRGATIQVLPAP